MKIYESKHNPTLKLIWFNGISDRPNLSAYLAMRQDYSPDPIYLKYEQIARKSEDELGELVWEKAVKFHHHGVQEHTGLVFNIVGFPHDVPMQHRTHRVGVSFDVMSQRYTGQHFKKEYDKQLITANGNQIFSDEFIEQYFYFDVIGETYTDRNGAKYQHTSTLQQKQIQKVRRGLIDYCEMLEDGIPEEKARRFLPQGIRQHYIFSCNPRSLEHLLDVRTPKDVQFEFRLLSELFMEFYQDFNSVMAQHYKEKRYQKNRLAP